MKKIILILCLCLNSFCLVHAASSNDEDWYFASNYDENATSSNENATSSNEDWYFASNYDENTPRKVRFETKMNFARVFYSSNITREAAREYYENLLVKKDRYHGFYFPIADAIYKDYKNQLRQAVILIDLASSNPYGKNENARPFIDITFMVQLFDTEVDDPTRQPLNGYSQFVTMVAKCASNNQALRIAEIYNKKDNKLEEVGFLDFNIDRKIILDYVCAHMRILNKSGY